ncbi:hypothetical protein [Erythrobacter crassostreae]|uniref:Transmembrane protein n=1 Tax=Erythrobacter crassostreae TaxID=2828328 RepID=A0A9X1F2M1_9SPHN|nr:hypothetical protein [Erythrobacter crassostrea]MBV7258861.1 hypothetical protein [Erythrobacter crassostrea]
MTTHDSDQQQHRPRPVQSFSRPAIVSILLLASVLIPATCLVAMVLAYIWRRSDDTEAWEVSHFTYLIRTFWLGFALIISAFIVAIAFIVSMYANNQAWDSVSDTVVGVAMMGVAALFLLVTVGLGVRCVLSLVKALKSEPMPNPKSWLF